MKKGLVIAFGVGLMALGVVGGTVLAQGGGGGVTPKALETAFTVEGSPLPQGGRGDVPQVLGDEAPLENVVPADDEDTCLEDGESVPATETTPAMKIVPAIGGPSESNGGEDDAVRMGEAIPVGEIVPIISENNCHEEADSIPASETIPAMELVPASRGTSP